MNKFLEFFYHHRWAILVIHAMALCYLINGGILYGDSGLIFSLASTFVIAAIGMASIVNHNKNYE